MIFEDTSLEGLKLISPEHRTDERGYFFRAFCKNEFESAGIPSIEFVQLNQSFNKVKGTFRGMHFQYPPFAEDKLVRCVTGAIYDIAVDIRKGSPTFLKWQGLELSAENHNMLFIPKGFAHGFLTLEANTTILYHHTAFYTRGQEGGLSIMDQRLGIELPEKIVAISDRDKRYEKITENFLGIDI